MSDSANTQQQGQTQTPSSRNDPAVDPQVANNQPANSAETHEAHSAAREVDQKKHHQDNDNTYSPGFKPEPDRPGPGDKTDADIDTADS
ncbi:hypothetical protein OC610_13935 [Pseudomonas sp. SAICEU22]|jgi:hypothetical protein|uniref:Uncharacterized protein n=2 Tax=Pseudomonas TaxID=286 RepID=A0ABT3F8U9_9PSED|nr:MULTISPECIES: hypothetical protein [Pseudomonas]MBJ2349975.1 hypothetical protein [Pseudomonas canavaninivorans]MBL3545068.1 hypothetical protein [Pseudomonas sp. HB05]MCL6702669.1 hypothetical protein [Pseudomonas sp. T1.Ur]MCW1245515.1 hypothetical protein [Pseudomonas agronomica]QXI55465.1 hypothetical protein KSS97_11200 [Pseudomonas alvandae]